MTLTVYDDLEPIIADTWSCSTRTPLGDQVGVYRWRTVEFSTTARRCRGADGDRCWTDSGRVFTSEDGRTLRPDWVYRTLRRLAAGAGLPPTDVHGLRHAYATSALRSGVDLDVLSKRLGHASVSITLDVYTHVRRGDDAAAAAKAAANILGRRAQDVPKERFTAGE